MTVALIFKKFQYLQTSEAQDFEKQIFSAEADEMRDGEKNASSISKVLLEQLDVVC